MECRSATQHHWLAIRIRQPLPRLQCVDTRPSAPQTPSGFVMALRKHIEGLAILAIEHTPQTRWVAITLGTRDAAHFTLFVDLTPSHANLYLLDTEHVVRAYASAQHAALANVQIGEPLELSFDERADAAPPIGTNWPKAADELWPYLHETFDAYDNEWRLQHTRRSALKRIRSALKRCARTHQRIEADLQRTEDADRLRHEADLLQSVRNQVRRGQTHVDVFDWARTDAQTTRIMLDPSRTIAEEIERRYRTYRRLHAAEDRILQRFETIEQDKQALQQALHEVEPATDRALIEARVQDLERRGLIPRIHEAERIRERARLPFREARSSDGYRILIGRTARDNDTLTLKIARGRDIWLHARESSGSHVIVLRPRELPLPDRTLHEAAVLAAVYSSASKDVRVEVGWTERKHVSKPAGAPAGRVHVASMRTLVVPPDEALAHELIGNARAHERGAD